MKRFPTCNRVETDEVAKFDSVTLRLVCNRQLFVSPMDDTPRVIMVEFNRTCWSKDGAKMGALRVDT